MQLDLKECKIDLSKTSVLTHFFIADWATRVKQIAKLWRKASSQERAPYVVRTITTCIHILPANIHFI